MIQTRVQTVDAPYLPTGVQEEINRIAGLNPFDGPWIRLEWGGRELKHGAHGQRAKYPQPGTRPERRMIGWLERRTDGREVNHPVSMEAPNVRADSLVVPKFEDVTLADPCWYLAEWVPALRYGSPEDWNRVRHSSGVDGVIIDLLGPYPSQGRYESLLRLVDVDTNETLRADDSRIPEIVRRYVSVGDRNPLTRHWENEPTEKEKQAALSDMWNALQTDEEARDKELREKIANQIAPMANKILGIPQVFTHQ